VMVVGNMNDMDNGGTLGGGYGVLCILRCSLNGGGNKVGGGRLRVSN